MDHAARLEARGLSTGTGTCLGMMMKTLYERGASAESAGPAYVKAPDGVLRRPHSVEYSKGRALGRAMTRGPRNVLH